MASKDSKDTQLTYSFTFHVLKLPTTNNKNNKNNNLFYPFRNYSKLNQRLPEQLMDEWPNAKFTFAPVAKRVFERNYWYENKCHLRGHSHENQVIFMGNVWHKHSFCK